MNISELFAKINRFKFIIAATLVLVFVLGLLMGFVFNDKEYRTVTEINVNRVSLNIGNSFDDNYYYLYFRYFLNSNNFASEIRVDFFSLEDVHKKAYEELSKMGYDISYDEFAAGIEVDKRDSSKNYRMVTMYPDKSLSEDAMELLLAQTQIAFNDDITGRITAEINHRIEKGDLILEQIEMVTAEIEAKTKEINNCESEEVKKTLETNLILSESELNNLITQYESNLTHIGRMQQVEDFPFWELYERETRYIEHAEEISRNAVGIGLTAVVFTSLAWLIGLYAVYIVKDNRREDG